MGNTNLFALMEPQTRLERARKVTDLLTDHVRILLAIHENNRIIVYSQDFADKMPRSIAAHAFNLFRGSMLNYEIIRLSALWDNPQKDAHEESIATVIELVDDDQVLSLFETETASNRFDKILTEYETVQKAARHGAINRRRLVRTISIARAIIKSSKLTSIRNLRNKHLAHSLSMTREEAKKFVAPVRFGDERKLLRLSCSVVARLHLALNQANLSLQDSQSNFRTQAECLWNACEFVNVR